MPDLRNSILATIIYYDVFDFPLTFAEVYKYLISPTRFTIPTSIVVRPLYSGLTTIDGKTADIVDELGNMIRAGLIGHKNGFYFLPGKENLYEARIEKDKVAIGKWRRFLRVTGYLQLAPYLRAVFASGSLASNNTELKSDFDVFIILKSGRLYTGRFFLWLISSLLGVRRGRFDLIAPDKLCFNHYVTEENVEIKNRSLYVAQSIVNLKPVTLCEEVVNKFSSLNNWVNSYCYNFNRLNEYRVIRQNKFFLLWARAGEMVLNNFFGNAVERFLKAIQQRRIKNNPATYESGGRIVFTDNELEFHPRSFERTVIDNYNKKLKKFGILGVTETDSGLR